MNSQTKVTLVLPPTEVEAPASEGRRLMDSLGGIAADVKLVDMQALDLAPEEIEQILRNDPAELVIVHLDARGPLPEASLPAASEIVYLADMMTGKAAVVGEIARRRPELFLSETPAAVVVCSQSVETFAALAGLTRWAGESLARIPGIIYREAGRLRGEWPI